MPSITKISVLSLLVIFLFTSCDQGVTVDSQLEPYYESFRVEAELRGIVFDNEIENIDGYLQNIYENGVLGLCNHDATKEGYPAIFVDKPYWDEATDMEREFVVYHELGHCFLKRGHLDDTDSTGACISIMQSGIGGCNSVYNSSTRSILLDELFSY